MPDELDPGLIAKARGFFDQAFAYLETLEKKGAPAEPDIPLEVQAQLGITPTAILNILGSLLEVKEEEILEEIFNRRREIWALLEKLKSAWSKAEEKAIVPPVLKELVVRLAQIEKPPEEVVFEAPPPTRAEQVVAELVKEVRESTLRAVERAAEEKEEIVKALEGQDLEELAKRTSQTVRAELLDVEDVAGGRSKVQKVLMEAGLPSEEAYEIARQAVPANIKTVANTYRAYLRNQLNEANRRVTEVVASAIERANLPPDQAEKAWIAIDDALDEIVASPKFPQEKLESAQRTVRTTLSEALSDLPPEAVGIILAQMASDETVATLRNYAPLAQSWERVPSELEKIASSGLLAEKERKLRKNIQQFIIRDVIFSGKIPKEVEEETESLAQDIIERLKGRAQKRSYLLAFIPHLNEEVAKAIEASLEEGKYSKEVEEAVREKKEALKTLELPSPLVDSFQDFVAAITPLEAKLKVEISLALKKIPNYSPRVDDEQIDLFVDSVVAGLKTIPPAEITRLPPQETSWQVHKVMTRVLEEKERGGKFTGAFPTKLRTWLKRSEEAIAAGQLPLFVSTAQDFLTSLPKSVRLFEEVPLKAAGKHIEAENVAFPVLYAALTLDLPLLGASIISMLKSPWSWSLDIFETRGEHWLAKQFGRNFKYGDVEGFEEALSLALKGYTAEDVRKTVLYITGQKTYLGFIPPKFRLGVQLAKDDPRVQELEKTQRGLAEFEKTGLGKIIRFFNRIDCLLGTQKSWASWGKILLFQTSYAPRIIAEHWARKGVRAFWKRTVGRGLNWIAENTGFGRFLYKKVLYPDGKAYFKFVGHKNLWRKIAGSRLVKKLLAKIPEALLTKLAAIASGIGTVLVGLKFVWNRLKKVIKAAGLYLLYLISLHGPWAAVGGLAGLAAGVVLGTKAAIAVFGVLSPFIGPLAIIPAAVTWVLVTGVCTFLGTAAGITLKSIFAGISFHPTLPSLSLGGLTEGLAALTPPIITSAVGIPIVGGLISMIVMSAAFAPFGERGVGEPIVSRFIRVEKVASFSRLENSQLPTAVDYTITITATQKDLTNVRITDRFSVFKEGASLTVSPPSPPTPDEVGTILKGQSYTDFGYSLTFGPEFADSSVVNTLTVTADVVGGLKNEQTSVSAAVLIGAPPTGCFVFDSSWTKTQEIALETQAIARLLSSPAYRAKLCSAGSITLKRRSTNPGYGGRAPYGSSEIIIYNPGLGSLANALYTLAHESGHTLSYRNGAVFSTFRNSGVFLPPPDGEGFLCSYPFEQSIAEDLPETIGVYVTYKLRGYRRCGGMIDMPRDYPLHFEFAKDNIFEGFEY